MRVFMEFLIKSSKTFRKFIFQFHFFDSFRERIYQVLLWDRVT